jgi:Flp pilus assembly secretin CpaC
MSKTVRKRMLFLAGISLFLLGALLCLCHYSWAEDDDSEVPAPAEAAPALISAPALDLIPGQKYPIEGLLPKHVSIENPEVLASLQTEQGTLLIAKAPGQTTAVFDTGDQKIPVRVRVRPRQTHESVESPEAVLRKMPGIQLQRWGKKLLIQGEILSLQDYKKVLLLLSQFPSSLLVLATAAPGIKMSLVESAKAGLQKKGLQTVQLSNAGNRFFIEGSVGSPEDVIAAFEVARTFIPNVENHLAIPIRVDPTVVLRLFILELSRHAHEQLGLSWPASVPKAALVQPGLTLFSPLWTATLKHLSQNGWAKVLAEPVLSVKSRASAELSAGGEIPIRVLTAFENKVLWKYYGLKVNIHVEGIAGKTIRLKVRTESSHLDEATASEGIPGIRSTKLSTEIDAAEGRPILLTGLFQSSIAKDVEKVPLIGSLPLIGELFKSRRFREHESELLIALLPSFGPLETQLPLESMRGLNFDFKWRPLD